MSEEDLINTIEYLVKKYAPNRDDLIETIKNNPRSAKGGGMIYLWQKIEVGTMKMMI